MRHIGNVVYGQPYQGFESLHLRHPSLLTQSRGYADLSVAKRGATAAGVRRTAGTGNKMFYVYILQSINNPDVFYVGFYTNLKQRLEEHNSGKSIHTNKYKPWRIKNYFAFDNMKKAKDFEIYLKTHSGRKFCKNHF